MEAFNFTVANEDHNLYTFDMRRMDTALNVHKDHVSAVLSVDYSPTGREFVSGSYDKTVRIFEYNKGHSREVYIYVCVYVYIYICNVLSYMYLRT